MRRNLMRRLCAILMVCAGFLYVVSAFGESISVGDFSYSYDMTTKEATLTKYNGSSEHITIPETFTVSETYRDEDDGEMHTRHHKITVTGIGSSVFQDKTFVASVSFHNKLKIIGNLAFYGCTSLASVSFLDSLTSIGYCAFFDCRSISGKLSLPNVKIIDFSAFSRCKGLTSVDFGAVVSIGGCAFSDCTSLTTVSFPETLKSIDDSAFSGCTSLSSLSFPETLKSIGDSAFRGCTSLSSLSFHNSLTTIGSEAFRNCISLKTFKTPSSLKLLDSRVLSGCTGLESAEIDGDGLHVGKSVFEYCTRLRSVVYGDGVSEIKGGIDTSGSSSLASSTYSFANCTNLQCIVVKSTAVKSIPELFCNMPSLTTLSFAGTITNIGNYALCNCSGLVAIDATLRPVTIGHSAFSDCVNLNPSVDFSDCTSIGFSAFSGCWSMTGDLSLPKITDVPSRAFFCCRKITGVNLGSATTIGSEAFCGCWTLASVSLSDSLTTIGSWAFRYCYALASISFPNTLTSIGSYAFQGCRTLESFKTPSSLRVLDAKALMNCTGLESVQFGASLASIGSSAFYNCTNVSSFAFASAPPSVGSSAFSNVKKGAIGTYTAAHAAEWEAVIDSKGYWNGLKMKPSYYTVIYDANNGTGARTTATVEWGEPMPAGDGSFTWEAHYFMGWAIEDVGGSTLETGDTIPEPEDGNTVTLYAVWVSNKPILTNDEYNVTDGSLRLNWANSDAPMPQNMTYEIRRGFTDSYEAAEILTNGYDKLSYVDTQFDSTGGTSRIWYWVKPEHESFEVSDPCITKNRYFLSVGFGTYGPGVKDKGITKDDAELAADVAADMGGFLSVRGTSEGMCITDRYATLANLNAAIDLCADRVRPGDIFFCYLATHGSMGTEEIEPQLLLYNGQRLMYSRLAKWCEDITASQARFVCVIMACHSEALMNGGKIPANDVVLENLDTCGLRRCGAYSDLSAWVTSCSAEELSWKLAASAFSRFTMAFCGNGWVKGYADVDLYLEDTCEWIPSHGDGRLTLREIAEYTKKMYIGGAKESNVQINNPTLLSRIDVGASHRDNNVTALAAPKNVKIKRVDGVFSGDRQIVSWDAVYDADEYRIYRQYGVEKPILVYVVPWQTTSYEDNTKWSWLSTNYKYYIQAVNASGISIRSDKVDHLSAKRGSVQLTESDVREYFAQNGVTLANDLSDEDWRNLHDADLDGDGVVTSIESISGVSPVDSTSQFSANITIENGQPKVTPNPDLGTKRQYTIYGKKTLNDPNADWDDVTNKDLSEYRFFKVTVDLP